MSIEIRITIPSDEVGDGNALSARMAALGFFPPAPAAQTWQEAAGYGKGDHQFEPVANHSQEAKPEPKKTRAKKAEPAPNISSHPEARVDPQDEADEAAEVAASVPANPLVTAEDLRAAMGAYAAKFGMPATLEDGTAIFAGALGEAPESGWKLSVVAGIGGETLAKAERAWSAAAAGEARYGA
jgi:hypothetical protein